VTEAEARGALRTFVAAGVAAGEIERWIAAQPWQPMEKGWAVPGSLHDGWRFWVEPVSDGVRVIVFTGEGAPVVWVVPTKSL
jgi:hypothetical protein